jgi:hypothetical protein
MPINKGKLLKKQGKKHPKIGPFSFKNDLINPRIPSRFCEKYFNTLRRYCMLETIMAESFNLFLSCRCGLLI